METLKKVPGWAEQFLFPKLNSIEGELKAIHSRIDTTNTKIDEMDKRLTTRIDEMDKRLTTNMESMRNELRAEIKTVDNNVTNLDRRLDFAPRFAVLEEKVRELERRSNSRSSGLQS